MSGNPVRRFPFSQWIQRAISNSFSDEKTGLPGDTTADFLNIKSTDPETFGVVTLANSVSYQKLNDDPDYFSVTDEPYQKMVHLQSPALYSGDLVGATKIEIVAKFKVKQYPPLGSQYVVIQTIPVEWDPYLMFRFYNELADPNWVGSISDDDTLLHAVAGILPNNLFVAPGTGIAGRIRAASSFFPTHTPCHGKVFSNGVCPLGVELTDGSEIAAVDAVKEYRLDISDKDFNFIQHLQGTVNISQVSIKSTVTQSMIVDLYGVWIEVTYAAKPSHGSSLLSSAG